MNEFRAQEKLELSTGLAQLPHCIEEKTWTTEKGRDLTKVKEQACGRDRIFSSGLSDLKSSVLSTSV